MKLFAITVLFLAVVAEIAYANETHETSTHQPENRRKRHDEENVSPIPEIKQTEVARAKRHEATTFASIVEEEVESLAKHNSEESESAGVKKRHVEENESTTVATAEESQVEKREADETEAEAEIETVEPENEASSIAEEEEGETGESSQEHENTTETAVESHVARAKRVSHAGSSHKNRPSAVNRLQSNSNNNVGGNPDEDETNHEPEFDNFHTV